MYVNDLTTGYGDMGERGVEEAVARLARVPSRSSHA